MARFKVTQCHTKDTEEHHSRSLLFSVLLLEPAQFRDESVLPHPRGNDSRSHKLIGDDGWIDGAGSLEGVWSVLGRRAL